MEGINGYEDEYRSPVKRKLLETDGMSSDDERRLRKMEKRARREERRARKEAKALRRESKSKGGDRARAEDPQAASGSRDEQVEDQGASGTWANPTRLSYDEPVTTAPRQPEESTTSKASKARKGKRKAMDEAPGRGVEPGEVVQAELTPAIEAPTVQQDAGNVRPASTAKTAAEQDASGKKAKRKRVEEVGKVKDGANKEPEVSVAAGGTVTKDKEKKGTRNTVAPIKAASTATQASTAASTALAQSTKARKPAAPSEPPQLKSPPGPRSTSSTPVPTARPPASSYKIMPAIADISNADSFRAKSRKGASASSAAGPSAARKSKETDDELRRKLRTSDAINSWLAEQWRPLPELQRLESLGIITYVRGKFSADEKAAIKSHLDLFRRVNGLSQSDLVNVIMAKGRFKTGYDKFWVETAAVCPGRPIQAVKKYVQREYDPRGKQGPWSKEEDNDLRKAYANHPNEWTKIAMSVGRTEQDCRDRYKNDLGTKDTRATGAWSKEEEAKLIEIVKNVNTTVGNDPLGHEAPWDIVEERMGGTRSRMQCRKKWQGQLRFSEMGNGQRAIFSKSERPFLVKYILRQHVDSEVDIDWVKLASGIFSGLPSEALRNAYKAMKKSLKLPDNISFENALRAMEKKWPIDSSADAPPKLQSSTKELGRRLGRHVASNVSSPRFVSEDSDEEQLEDVTGAVDPALSSGNVKEVKAAKKKGSLLASRVKELVPEGYTQAAESGMVSDSESGSEQDEANASEIDDIV